MNRQSAVTIAAALSLNSCAVLFPPVVPSDAATAPLDSEDRPVLPADTQITTVDITDVPPRQRCENLTRGGSRIVVAKRCRAPSDDGVDEIAVAEQLEQVRRDQEELDRRRREIEARRGPGL